MQTTLRREQRGLLSQFLAPPRPLAWLMGAAVLLLGSTSAHAQLSGAKAIPGSGGTGYATLAAAITDLNAQGAGTGGVTFNLAPGYTETAANLLITATGTAASPIVFQKGAGTGANPTITAAVGTSATLDAIIGLQGADYVTFDGLTLVDPATNTTATTQMEWGFALLKGATPTVNGCQNVVIRNCVITLQRGVASMGIYANNHTPDNATQLVPTTAAGTNSNNKFYGNTISGVNNGIYLSGYVAASPYTYYDQGNEIGSIVAGTAATGNTITEYGTTTTAYGVYASSQNAVKVQGNTVAPASATSTVLPTNIVYGIYLGTGGDVDILGNTLTITTGTLTSSPYGIYNASGSTGVGGASTTVNIANNNLTMTSATATTATFYGLYNAASTTNLNISGNTLSNWNRPGATAGFNYMLFVSSGATATQTVSNNTLSNFTSAGATSGVFGIYATNNPVATVQFDGNTVQNFACAGNTIYAMYLSSGTVLNASRNRIAGLTASGTTATIYGLYTSGVTTNVTNNLIGDLNTPNSSNTTAQLGLYVAGGTTVNAQYNSIYLNGTSTGTNFGTAGIYFTSTRTTLVGLGLRNNIVVNTSTAAGTGSTVALRRTAVTAGNTLANLLTTSNNNLYYAGTPSATNLLYAEGIVNASLTNPIQTLADYKTFSAGREGNSVTENVAFQSTAGTNANFLKINTTTPTQVESGGAPISGITTDYAGTTRSATLPDLGAYEGTNQVLDLTGPSITGALLANTNSLANRPLVLTIADPSGVATGASAPRLYYRKGTTGAFVFVNAASVSGSQYSFTLDNTLLTGGSVAPGDLIQYYVAAQDLLAPANLSTSPGGGGGITPPGTTAPATLSSYLVVANLNGDYYVGTTPAPAGTAADHIFPTLTAAVAAYNLDVLTGATTFYLVDAAYSAAETFPLIFTANPSASAANTLRISPYTNVNPVVTGTTTATSVVLLNAVSYITFDGSNTTGGTTRNLTFASANAGANAVLWVGSLGANAGSTNITLRNLNVTGGNTTNAGSFGIYASASPALVTTTPSVLTYGSDNDNLVIQNNAVGNAYEAIYARGTSVAASYDGLQIVDNRIGATLSGTATPAVGNVTFKGIDVQGATAPLISRNFVLGMYSTLNANLAAIELNDNVTNAVISRNAITGLRQLAPNGYGAFGVNLNTTTNITNTEISNNVISDVLNTAYNSSVSNNAFGIRLTGGTGTKVYYNAVNLTGSIAPTTLFPSPGNLTAAFMVNSALATGLDVRNNLFINSITSSATTSQVNSVAEYLADAGSLATSDYNDYFVSGLSGLRLAMVGTGTALTLADLRTLTAKDANALSVDPVFVSATSLLPANRLVATGGTPVSVTVDYTGAARPATTPSIGAYQFTPQTFDIAANALITPVNSATPTCYGATPAVIVQIRNNGSSALNFATNPLTVTVVIAGPASSTQTLTQTLSTGTLAAAATQNLTLTGPVSFAPLGVYTFAITATVTGDTDTSNDLLAPAPVLTVAAPVAGTLSPTVYSICGSAPATLTLTGAANGDVQLQSSSSATGPFTNIAGATSLTYTSPVLTSTTYYRAQVSCGPTVATSNVSTITVNNPVLLAAPSPLSTCAGSTATLSTTAPTGVSVRYFTTATGGTAIGSGNSFVTPVLTIATTYYAEPFAGSQENVGPAAFTNTSSALTPTLFGGLYFTTTGPTTLTSTTVFLNAGQAAGTVTIDLRNGSNIAGTLVNGQSQTFAVPAGPATGVAAYVIPLNYTIPAAGQYTLSLPSATQGGLLRDSGGPNPTGYPYTSPSGAVTITASSSSTYYYFFYNLQFGAECVGASRTPILVNVTPGLVASLPSPTAASCGRTPYQLAGTIAGTATGATYTTTGTGTFSPNATTLNATYTPSAADVTAGTVTLTLTPSGPAAPCSFPSQVAITLATPPNAAFSYPVGIYCTGSPTTVAPVLAAGAVAGTFSTTGIGLRIDPVTGVIDLARSISDGTYTIVNTITTTGACNGATTTTTITLQYGILVPTLSAVPQAGGGVILTSSTVAGATYQFFRGSTSLAPAGSSNTLTLPVGAQSGNYTVVVTASTGCSATSVISVVTATTASRNGVSLRVYPNPTTDGQLTVELQGLTAKASPLTVLNTLGQVVHTGTATAGTASLNLTGLAAGVYTVRVQTADGVLTQRVVRQ